MGERQVAGAGAGQGEAARFSGDHSVEAPPRQARSRETLRSLLAAAEALFDEVGFHVATVPEICRRAESSTGAFYKRFRDKDELLAVLFADLLADVRARLDARLNPAAVAAQDLGPLVASTVHALAQAYRGRAGTARALILVGEQRPEFQALSRQAHAELLVQVAQALAAKRAQFSHPNPRLAAEFVSRQLTAVFQQQVLTGGFDPQSQLPGWPALEQELVRAVSGYLGVRAPRPPAAPEQLSLDLG
ncbi:MAG: TetR/AcrR family transcriptional regulator [Pseudomonadota bacterium]